MIDARELRIGNWVINDCDDKFLKVEASYILTASKDNDWLLPIPITPELLEKCGFKQNYFYWEEKNMSLTQDLDGFHFIVHNEYEEGIPIIHLHQLQNLYYSLVGKELEINL